MIVLSSGNLELHVVAGCGSIAAFRMAVDGKSYDLLRPAATDVVKNREPLDMACFPLVPFSGAVWGGRFCFNGNIYILERNHPAEPYPIHGDGWIHPWRIEDCKQQEAALVYEHDGAVGFPFAYMARQEFRLDPQGLSVTISVTNLSEEEMPAGLGLHPYFPKTPDSRLTTENPLLWPDMGTGAERGPVTTPPSLDFSGGRLPGDFVLDHCFARWGRRATIRWPERNIALEMTAESPFDTVVIFIPEGEDYFCVEPVSNADDGFNRMNGGAPLHGVHVLRPGDALEGRVRFNPVLVTN